jgi:hypothetical protein
LAKSTPGELSANNIVRLCFRKILNGNPQWWPFDPGHYRGTATAEREPSPL